MGTGEKPLGGIELAPDSPRFPNNFPYIGKPVQLGGRERTLFADPSLPGPIGDKPGTQSRTGGLFGYGVLEKLVYRVGSERVLFETRLDQLMEGPPIVSPEKSDNELMAELVGAANGGSNGWHGGSAIGLIN